MRAQGVDVLLLVAELHGFDHGDPDAGSDVSHEIEQASGISHALIWNRAIGNGSERHEHKTERRTLNHKRPPEIHRSHVQAEPASAAAITLCCRTAQTQSASSGMCRWRTSDT